MLQELGSAGAAPMLNGSSHLERDLGLGSLERVELMARLETAFGVRLPDRWFGSQHAGRFGETLLDAPEGALEAKRRPLCAPRSRCSDFSAKPKSPALPPLKRWSTSCAIARRTMQNARTW